MSNKHLLVVILSCASLFAAETPIDAAGQIDPWLKSGVAVVALGAVIWVVQHLLRDTIPNQREDFREGLTKQREDFNTSLAEQRSTFLDQLETINKRAEQHDENFRQTMMAMMKSCEDTRRYIQKATEDIDAK